MSFSEYLHDRLTQITKLKSVPTNLFEALKKLSTGDKFFIVGFAMAILGAFSAPFFDVGIPICIAGLAVIFGTYIIEDDYKRWKQTKTGGK